MPVVLTQATKDWKALDKWTNEHLVSVIGDHAVDVNMCTFGRINFDIFEFKELAEDVLNERYFNSDVHNMVVRGAFIGAKDSATHFHKDTGENLVAVIRGCKYVIMVSPEDEETIKRVDTNIACSESDSDGVQINEHPTFVNCPKVYTTMLKAGDALYIPSRRSFVE
eukprot:gene12923-15180_t